MIQNFFCQFLLCDYKGFLTKLLYNCWLNVLKLLAFMTDHHMNYVSSPGPRDQAFTNFIQYIWLDSHTTTACVPLVIAPLLYHIPNWTSKLMVSKLCRLRVCMIVFVLYCLRFPTYYRQCTLSWVWMWLSENLNDINLIRIGIPGFSGYTIINETFNWYNTINNHYTLHYY